MPVSIREVAQHAGVSLGTVSKVLNDSEGAQIAPETRERVRRSAQTLGYHPSAVARALVRKRMDTLGVALVPGHASPLRAGFFGALFDAILIAAAARGQNVSVYAGTQWIDAAHSLRHYRDGRCDGFLIFYQPEPTDMAVSLAAAGVPLVLLNHCRDDQRLTCVDVDNVRGGRDMTAHLIGLGHRRIAFWTGYPRYEWAVDRRAGYRAALEAAGISYDPELVTDDDRGSGDVQIDALLALPASRRPTAIMCVADEMAVWVQQALMRRGLRVPDHISVAGFNDDGAADRQHPPITTMRQPYAALGERAVDLLLEQIHDLSRRGGRELLPAEVVARDSTAAPPPED